MKRDDTPLKIAAKGLLAGVDGSSPGPAHGIVHSSKGISALGSGIAVGLTAWTASLVELPRMKLAPPVWEHPSQEAAPHLSHHLVLGPGVAGAFEALRG